MDEFSVSIEWAPGATIEAIEAAQPYAATVTKAVNDDPEIPACIQSIKITRL